MNKTDLFLSEIDKISLQTIPNHVMQRAKLALLDYIGVTLAGLKEQNQPTPETPAAKADEGAKDNKIKESFYRDGCVKSLFCRGSF